eukprot:CAMPEP_0194374256 /NCGR_PEP_ID=MMETSP0174-20130528/22647_1 /TAXON_ID=216777 /ORGANISM="Proboscia alata, Strain PI-D3" /LENGTH=223 /DNA_ID=CAMNT_0039153721 /DNA_START=512 /DNA_END=1184 /DNA_ORIENTATION=-
MGKEIGKKERRNISRKQKANEQGEKNSPVAHLKNFFSTINIEIKDESNISEEDIERACDWICFIIVDKEARSDNEVKDILENEMIDKLPKACLRILYAYVPEPEKKSFLKSSTTTKNELAKWMKRSNSERAFLFRSKTMLESMISEKVIILQSNEKLIDKMIDALVFNSSGGSDKERSHQQIDGGVEERLVKALLLRSFIPRQKGQGQEHCSLGHFLELSIFL